MQLKKTYNIAKRFVSKRSDSPTYLIFFITSRCVAKCQHCFYWQKQTTEPELNLLSLNEIEKIAKTTRSLSFLLLTGGEPYLREELPEIAHLFYKYTPVRNLATPTNGILGNKIVQQAEKILKKCPDAKFTLNISIDGVGELHDIIRGTPGTFNKAVETYHELIKLKKFYKNFNVGMITTISTLNQDKIVEIHDFVRNKLNVPIWAPFLTRGNPRNPIIKNIDPEKYYMAGELLKKDIIDQKYKEYNGFIGARINSAKNVVRRELITRMLKENKYEIPCYAGMLNAVLYPEGDLYPCELRDEKIGNIRDFGLDMKKAWHSQKATDIIKNIKESKCFCTHECFLTTNMLYNIKLYPKFLYWWMKYI